MIHQKIVTSKKLHQDAKHDINSSVAHSDCSLKKFQRMVEAQNGPNGHLKVKVGNLIWWELANNPKRLIKPKFLPPWSGDALSDCQYKHH